MGINLTRSGLLIVRPDHKTVLSLISFVYCELKSSYFKQVWFEVIMGIKFNFIGSFSHQTNQSISFNNIPSSIFNSISKILSHHPFHHQIRPSTNICNIVLTTVQHMLRHITCSNWKISWKLSQSCCSSTMFASRSVPLARKWFGIW